jgi:hypothetical protein
MVRLLDFVRLVMCLAFVEADRKEGKTREAETGERNWMIQTRGSDT